MVLEHIFPDNWTEKRLRYSLIIGFVFSSLSILISGLLFGANSGLISVFLTSLLILPLLEHLFKEEELMEEKEISFSIRELYIDNKKAVTTYLFLFLSIFTTYALFVFIFNLFGIDVLSAFRGQLMLDFMQGGATFVFKNFWTILANNWWILLTIFVISILVKDGGIFFVTWNASSWGVILGYRAITSSLYTGGGSSIKLFFIVLALSFPFILLEGLSYIMAAVAGNIISKEVVRKTSFIKKIMLFFGLGTVIFIGLRQIMNFYTLPVWVSILSQIVIVLIILQFIFHGIKEIQYKEVFFYNYMLFVFAILLFIIGALVEVLITQNVDILTKIYSTSMLFGMVPS